MEKDFHILVNVIETVSKCCSVKVLLCHSVTVSQCHSVTVSKCRSVKVSLCCSVALSLHWKVYHAVRYVPIYGYLCNIYSTQFAHHEDVCSFNINDINL